MRKIFILFLLFLFYISSGFICYSQTSPLLFVPNEGQWKADFLYKGIAPFADIYLEKSGITYLVSSAENVEKIHHAKEESKGIDEAYTLKYHAYKMSWIGGNLSAKTIPAKKQHFYYNYFLGNEPTHWKSNVSIYGNVDYKDLYPQIDLHLSSDKGDAKYDFIVHPGGNTDKIKLGYEGLDNLTIKKGNLILATSVGEITEMAPYAYQYKDGNQIDVKCNFIISADGVVYFSFPNGYDKTLDLTIDPVIVFATLTGSVADNWGFTATYDEQGDLYAGGIASGVGYPTTLGAFQLTFGGGTSGSTMPCDVSISKFNPSGTSLLYSTYLGGNNDEMPHSLIVDGNGNLIVAGKTQSTNFPTTTNAFSTTNSGGFDFYITKFNSTGTALLASTYVGGAGDDGVNVSPSFYGAQPGLNYNYGDASRSEVIIDNVGNIYVAGSSQSANFPITSNAAKSSIGGTQDGVLMKFNPDLTTMIYGTYIGGSQNDAAYVLALDTAQTHVYVGGGTASSDFETSAMTGGYHSTYQGGPADGFICRFLNSGSYSLEKATFIGTSAYDQCYGLEVDLENKVYAMGQTLGAFPVSSGVYSNPGSPQFLIKLNDDLSSSIYSTVFGSGPSSKPNISPVAFLVDTCQNVYISGWASSFSVGTSTNGMPITNDAFQSTTDGSDFYFIVFSKNAQSLLFASFFGAPGKSEHVDGGTSRFDRNGVVYQAICASCGQGSAFPATPGAWATTKGGNNCNLGAVKIAFNLGSVKAQADANPNAIGCAPLIVQFGNTSSNATSYFWNFGDGTTSTTATPTHSFNTPGAYSVMMVAINPNACKTHDTVYLAVTVSSDTIMANFNMALADTCTNPNLSIQNTSVPRPGSTLGHAQFYWDFGDGNNYNGQNPPVHFYATPGTYSVRLIMKDTLACNSPDTITQTLFFSQEFVKADFTKPTTLCENTELTFQNNSQNASTFLWNFGNGQTSSLTSPTFTYDTAGTYTVSLIAYNPNTCNKVDSMSFTLSIASTPTAAFTVTPINPELNTPFTFHNQSQGATHYEWSFGDGAGSQEESPVHSFNKSGEFKVCLTAINQYGCKATVCKTLRSEVQSLVDLPTGFSPNGDGTNDILFVRGYNVAKMDLRIYNRWGEIVFESNDIKKGWDGIYKGKPQEMESYAYILDVVFLDGSDAHKTGNVTLLR